MNSIITSEDLKYSSVNIRCGEEKESGTGFYLSKNMILTAAHVIEDNEDIFINNVPIRCNVIKDDDKDVCLITLLENSKENHFLKLTNKGLQYNQQCKLFGFSILESSRGRFYEGVISDIDRNKNYFHIRVNDTDDDYDYSGVSGSAVSIGDHIIGIAIRCEDGEIKVIHVNAFSSFIEKAGIVVNPYKPYAIPEELQKLSDTYIPNYAFFDQLDEKLSNKQGWFICVGSPGSGKTTAIASYIPSNESIKVCGHYFLKIPQDKQSPAIRSSKNNIISWLETTLSNQLNRTIDSTNDIEKRIGYISSMLENLSVSSNGINHVMFIDGLDEIDNITDFLSVIPKKLPKGISIILSCTSSEILPANIKAKLEDKSISIPPLSIEKCEETIRRAFEDKEFTALSIQKLAKKSEGHPLYLNYLIESIKDYDDKGLNLETLIESMPTINGDIKEYYEEIWSSLSDKINQIWILIILSQLRVPIKKNQLYDILPTDHKSNFQNDSFSINYLIKEGKEIELYHTSFKNFIIKKAEENLRLANDYIVKYCIDNNEEYFSVENVLYHKTLSSNYKISIQDCNQQWSDMVAFNHVMPSLVIYDIKKVIKICLEEQDSTSLIRILLLLQRIEFRYESVLAEHSYLIAKALIALDKGKHAIKYIIRDESLLVSNNEALELLQLFNENNYREEGKALSTILDNNFRVYLQDEFGKVLGGFSVEPFFFQVKLTSLNFSLEDKLTHEQAFYSIDMILKLINFVRSNDSENHANDLGEEFNKVVPFSNAYLRRMSNEFDSLKEFEEVKGELNKNWTRLHILEKVNYDFFNKYSNKQHFNGKKELVSLIEELIDKYGYEENERNTKILILGLITDSKRTDIVENAIQTYLNKYVQKNIKLSFRSEKNGVDLDDEGLRSFYMYNKFIGYLKTDELAINIPSYYFNWELSLENCLMHLGMLEGRLNKKFAEGNDSSKELESLKKIALSLKFDLDERSTWKRSYFLPEVILPFIYEQITDIFSTYFNSNLGWWIERIVERSRYQLGLYTEGYRNSLSDIIERLIKNNDKRYAHQVIKLLESHILEHIQNRWERTPELLKVVEYYGLIKCFDKGEDVFKEMLKTSMGPSWYKEAQFQLINSVAENTNLQSQKDYNYLQNACSLIDYASGEMTFQQYIRNTKTNLATTFLNEINFSGAIEYVKFETVPPPQILIQNAESNKLDNLKLGYGYVQGANNIDIHSAIVEIIKCSDESLPELNIFLLLIFTINNDTPFCFKSFATSIANNLIKVGDREHRIIFYDCIYGILLSEEMKDYKNEYNQTIFNQLSDDLKTEYEELFKEKGIYIDNPKSSISNESNKDIQTEQSELDKFNSLCENDGFYSLGREGLIKNGVNAFKNSGLTGIWYNRFSKDSDQAKDNLKSLFDNDKEIIKYLQPFINNIDTEAWVVVENLIDFFANKLTSDQIIDIRKSIIEHFNLLVYPPQYIIEKYQWVNGEKEEISANEAQISFIIWLLNYPTYDIRKKTFATICYLIKMKPSFALVPLLNESLKDKPLRSVELCVDILLKNIEECFLDFIDILKGNSSYLEQIKNIRHLSIFKKYLDIASFLKDKGFSSLHNEMNNNIKNIALFSPNIAVEDRIVYDIQYILDDLESGGFLSKDFYKEIINTIEKCCYPLSWQEYKKSDSYLARSFVGGKSLLVRYPELQRYALNKAAMNVIGKNNINQLYQIINQY
ncbi:trypsin-like peptidase domain-containing protein [Bernardetia sp. OM2101]|uniref:serine protease n=1 Tax=Bernardetia sp. OM2101 TaxID=3344876 RepID=UPI0035CF0DD3